MAKKQAAKTKAAKTKAAKTKAAKTNAPVTVSRADEAAAYIGESLADLMNRKDALVRQLANVNQRIASVSQVGSRLVQAVPRFVGLGRAEAVAKTRKAGKKTGNGKRKRPLPPDQPMVAQTERVRAAEARSRAAKRVRTSSRSGDRSRRATDACRRARSERPRP